MKTQFQELGFLQQKIDHIQEAIFSNLSDSAARIPTSVVSTLQVDDFGYVWFMVKKPEPQNQEMETEFPVQLDFFEKASDCSLLVRGKGYSVTNAEEISTFLNANKGFNVELLKTNVLVKVKMLKADYFETQTNEHKNWWENTISSISNWFGSYEYMQPGRYFKS